MTLLQLCVSNENTVGIRKTSYEFNEPEAKWKAEICCVLYVYSLSSTLYHPHLTLLFVFFSCIYAATLDISYSGFGIKAATITVRWNTTGPGAELLTQTAGSYSNTTTKTQNNQLEPAFSQILQIILSVSSPFSLSLTKQVSTHCALCFPDIMWLTSWSSMQTKKHTHSFVFNSAFPSLVKTFYMTCMECTRTESRLMFYYKRTLTKEINRK